MTPLPARITGICARPISSAACAIFAADACGVAATWTRIGGLSTSIDATFSGKSMKVAPGFSVWATLNALRTTSGTISGSRIWVANLVIGLNNAS